MINGGGNQSTSKPHHQIIKQVTPGNLPTCTEPAKSVVQDREQPVATF